MRLFQLVALPLIAAMLVVSIRNLVKVPARRLAALFWVGLWLAMFVAVMYPETTTRIARTIGIGRGADLVVYSAVLVFSAGFYVVSARLRQLSREITVLTRELALLDAERRQDGPPSRPA